MTILGNMITMVKDEIPRIRNETTLKNTVAGLSSETLVEWLGIGKGRRDATSDITYFTCLKTLSETLGKMPLKFKARTDKGIVDGEQTEMSRLLTRRPNPYTTPTIFWTAVEMNRNHYGNAYIWIQNEFVKYKFGGKIIPVGLWLMPSQNVRVLVDNIGYFGQMDAIYYWYTDSYSGKSYVFRNDEVLHFKTSHTFNGIVGKPVAEVLAENVEADIDSQAFMNKLYKNGLTAKAVLEYTGDLNQAARDKLRQTFEEFGNGTKNTGRILPVPLGMKLTPLDIKLTDSQFFELKKYSASQLAAAFGVKPNQINDYEKSSYSNSEMQQLDFYINTEIYTLKQYEEEINYKCIEKDQQDEYYYKFNEKVLLRTDSQTQMNIFGTGIDKGVYTANEVRRKLDLSDAEGGDKLLVNGTYIPLENVGQQYGIGGGED